MVQKNASDLHLKSGRPPLLRIRGELTTIGDTPLEPSVIRNMIAEIISDTDKQKFDRELELDCAYSLAGVGRFRINVFLQRQQIGVVIRLIPLEIKSLDQLGFSQILKDMALKQKGLILVTGPTGSGKSTTLAAIVNHIN
ncbi:MAG: type IV pili twitching motility protein PilT, partial [Candidatus Omnitrophica bacterium CG23_combo_of_CG06-09_8_20_14_all_41_10]